MTTEATRDEVEGLLAELERLLGGHAGNPALEQLRAEAQWARQELAAERLELPLRSTSEMYLYRALADGELEAAPEARETAERVAEGMMRGVGEEAE